MKKIICLFFVSLFLFASANFVFAGGGHNRRDHDGRRHEWRGHDGRRHEQGRGYRRHHDWRRHHNNHHHRSYRRDRHHHWYRHGYRGWYYDDPGYYERYNYPGVVVQFDPFGWLFSPPREVIVEKEVRVVETAVPEPSHGREVSGAEKASVAGQKDGRTECQAAIRYSGQEDPVLTGERWDQLVREHQKKNSPHYLRNFKGGWGDAGCRFE